MNQPTSLLVACLFATAGLAGCIGGEDVGGDATPASEQTPSQTNESWARELPETVTGLEPVAQLEGAQAGSGLDTHGDYVYLSGQNSGFHVVDVSNPESPEVVGNLTGNYTRDVDLIHYENRTVAAAATNGDGMWFIDVTDPREPELVSTVLTDALVHNVGVIPGTHLVYSARSTGDQLVDVVNASNPDNPEVVETLDQLACHDVSFGPKGQLAMCPAHVETQIWNITDPMNPEIVSRIHNPSIQIHHWATMTPDRQILIIGDEFAGSTNVAAGCFAAQDTPVGTRSDSIGAAWFYDVSNPAAPVPLSWVAPPVPTENTPPAPCTAHFGEILPGRDKVVIGWRAAGTVLVDYSDPMQPVIVDRIVAKGDNWDTQYHNGYLFSGDTERGMDVMMPVGDS